MATLGTRIILLSAGLAMTASTAIGQITLRNSPDTYLESEARGSGGRVIAGRVDPVIGAPFASIADAGSSLSITAGLIENYGIGAMIEINLTQRRSGSFSHFGAAVASINFHLDAPFTYDLSGSYPNATIGHASLSVSLVQTPTNITKYRGQKDLYVPGVLVVGDLPNFQTGSITGTLEAGDYSLSIGTLQYAHTTGLQGTTSAGTVTLIIGELPCYADCDQSTGAGVLDLFDFLCFQNSFVNSEPYACDCDTSTGAGVCDLFDFLCFQDAFVAGCP